MASGRKLRLGCLKAGHDYAVQKVCRKHDLIAATPPSVSDRIECVVRQQNCFPRIIGQSRSKAVNGRIITADQSIKTCVFRLGRRLSSLIRSLRLSAECTAAWDG